MKIKPYWVITAAAGGAGKSDKLFDLNEIPYALRKSSLDRFAL